MDRLIFCHPHSSCSSSSSSCFFNFSLFTRYQKSKPCFLNSRNRIRFRKFNENETRMMMLRSCYRCLGRRGGTDGLMWHTDLKPHASGDYSIAVVQANASLEDQSQVFTSPSATYVGVYDGHGGPEASRFVNKHLFPYLHSNSYFSLVVLTVFCFDALWWNLIHV